MTHRVCSVLLVAASAALFAGSPACKPPDPPKPPDGQPPPPPPGNCCLRNAEPAEATCGPTQGCCKSGLDRDQCEAKNGLWFHSPEGCAGAC